ncbi:hypothetical protein [Lysobacter panacisoli]|uniref:Transmembrane protein n=1 Tax=Lysobacter panacisoli TaxID=1255263 RepID=A0ABP9L735_9GAMM|nr:hypothetical protein [Lysobacter panacisoli]
MNPLVELNLALILFLPWFAILGVLFWMFPRHPRHAARKLFDGIALLLAFTAFVLSLYWSHASADPVYGRMWQQVLATAVGYGVFLAVLTAAFFVRRRWLRRHR